MLKPGIPYSHFESADSMSLAIAASSSFAIEADPDDLSSVQFRIPSQSAGTTHDRVAFYISGSGEIGIGTKDPATSFDVRDIKQDVDPKQARSGKEALLKLSRTAEERELQADQFRTARNIGGVSFDGTANINLPGVNTSGNQDTTGTAASASVLATARSIGGVAFNGSRDITPATASIANNIFHPRVANFNVDLSTGVKYIPLSDGETEAASSTSRRVQFLAPCSGSLHKIYVRSNSSTLHSGASKTLRVQAFRSINGTSGTTQMGSDLDLNTVTGETVMQGTFSGATNQFAMGDRLYIGMSLPERVPTGDKNYYVTVVFNLDQLTM